MLTLKRPSSVLPAFKCALPWQGNPRAKIMIVVDPPILTEDQEAPKTPLSKRTMTNLAPYMKAAGIKGEDVLFVAACRPVQREEWDSDSKLGKIVKEQHPLLERVVERVQPRIIIAMGKAAARQVYNRPVKITKIRGVGTFNEELNAVVFPTLSMAHVMRVPEHGELFGADIMSVSRIINAGFSLDAERPYYTVGKWCVDLQPVIDEIAKRDELPIGLDIEASCFGANEFSHWYLPETKILTVQITYKAGESLVIPIDYPQFRLSPIARNRIVRQLKTILEHPKVKCVGHNLKFDWQTLRAKLGIRIRNYEHDTVLMIQMLNENMLSKGLEDVTRVYLPRMAGHKDDFIRKGYSYSRMDLVPADDMLPYAAGDSDAVFQLRDELLKRIQADPKLYNCYNRVVMPAMRAFCDVEQNGFKINTAALETLRKKISDLLKTEEPRLLAMIPEVIKAKYRDNGVGLKLTRRVMIKDFLFDHPRGFKFKPRVFTKSKEISVSTKQHLPYFVLGNDFVADYIKFSKNEHILNSFIGRAAYTDEQGVRHDNTGFWQYIYNGYIRPSYLLHGTVTGRTSSRDPNGQNFPKRGEFAKEYRAIFEPPDGWYLLEGDFSQVELRIAGILAKEPTFLKLYREGADIHCATAAVVMGMSLDKFMALKETDPETFDLNRFRAKAVNFGFIYGMGWRKFMVYAKTEYNIDYTEEEAQRIRKAFFGKYKGLENWHLAVQSFVDIHHYVRAIDGRVRHLPAVVVDDDGVASSARRQAINSPVQAFASDLGIMALARLNSEVSKDIIRVAGFVHDALICFAKKGHEIEASRILKRYMETNPLKEWFNFTSPIPIIADIKIGSNLSKMIELRKSWLDDPKITTYEQVKKLEDEARAKASAPKKTFKILPRPQRKLGMRH